MFDLVSLNSNSKKALGSETLKIELWKDRGNPKGQPERGNLGNDQIPNKMTNMQIGLKIKSNGIQSIKKIKL